MSDERQQADIRSDRPAATRSPRCGCGRAAARHAAVAQGAGGWRGGRSSRSPARCSGRCRTIGQRTTAPANSTPPSIAPCRRWPGRSAAGLCRRAPAGPAARAAAARRSRPADPERAKRAVDTYSGGCDRSGSSSARPGNRSGALQPAVRFDQYPRAAVGHADTGAGRATSTPAPRRVRPPSPRPTMPLRRMARTASSPSSTPRSIAAPPARIGSQRRRRPMWCRPETSSRRRSSPASARICPARSPRR